MVRISASSICRTKSTGPSHFRSPRTGPAQVENRISHKLSRPVVGHVSAAVGLHHLDSARGQRLFTQQQILPAPSLRPWPTGQHRRMLQHHQHVPDGSGFAQRHQPSLDLQPFAIRNPPKIQN